MRKRNSLDTSEADFIFAGILLVMNRDNNLMNLPIPLKNQLIDAAGLNAIKKVHPNEEDVEAIYFEFTSYKLSNEEREKSLQNTVYSKIEKPKGFIERLREKYSGVIEQAVREEYEKINRN